MFIAKEIQMAAYLFASILFILSLGGLSSQESAKRGVLFGIVGMIVAIIATVLGEGVCWTSIHYCCYCHCFG
jgi:NAD(P) transhydrogenase subunit beta